MGDTAQTLESADGRTVSYFDSGPGVAGTLVWHPGTPHTGRPQQAVAAAARERGLRLVSVARPGYGGSTRLPGRSVADAAREVIAVLDRLGVDDFVTVGSSGGGPHALALAAIAADRASGVATFASLAPFAADDEGWFDGMADQRALRAAVAGVDARTEYAWHAEFDASVFTPADWAALAGQWADLGGDAQAAGAAGPEGQIDDDRAFVSDWGVELAGIRAQILIVQGEEDRMVPAGHATRLLRAMPGATSWWFAEDGHVSALRALPHAIDWLLDNRLSSPWR